jgi:hypothetical protein
LDGEKLSLASAACHFEQTRLLEMAHLAHDGTLQRRSAGLASSGQSFSAVNGSCS